VVGGCRGEERRAHERRGSFGGIGGLFYGGVEIRHFPGRGADPGGRSFIFTRKKLFGGAKGQGPKIGPKKGVGGGGGFEWFIEAVARPGDRRDSGAGRRPEGESAGGEPPWAVYNKHVLVLWAGMPGFWGAGPRFLWAGRASKRAGGHVRGTKSRPRGKQRGGPVEILAYDSETKHLAQGFSLGAGEIFRFAWQGKWAYEGTPAKTCFGSFHRHQTRPGPRCLAPVVIPKRAGGLLTWSSGTIFSGRPKTGVGTPRFPAGFFIARRVLQRHRGGDNIGRGDGQGRFAFPGQTIGQPGETKRELTAIFQPLAKKHSFGGHASSWTAIGNKERG